MARANTQLPEFALGGGGGGKGGGGGGGGGSPIHWRRTATPYTTFDNIFMGMRPIVIISRGYDLVQHYYHTY